MVKNKQIVCLKDAKAVQKMTSKALSTSAKRIQKELAEITIDPPPNCRYVDMIHGPIDEI